MTEVNNDTIQVIQELENGKIRVFNIVEGYLVGDNDSGISTITIDGEYKDVDL